MATFNIDHPTSAYLRPMMEALAGLMGVKLDFVATEAQADLIIVHREPKVPAEGKNYLVVRFDASCYHSRHPNVHYIPSGVFGTEFKKILDKLREGCAGSHLPQTLTV